MKTLMLLVFLLHSDTSKYLKTVLRTDAKVNQLSKQLEKPQRNTEDVYKLAYKSYNLLLKVHETNVDYAHKIDDLHITLAKSIADNKEKDKVAIATNTYVQTIINNQDAMNGRLSQIINSEKTCDGIVYFSILWVAMAFLAWVFCRNIPEGGFIIRTLTKLNLIAS